MVLFVLILTIQNIKAQEVTITLTPVWTWVGIPSTEILDFDTALSSFTPMEGDMIKSQWGIAKYTNGRWRGPVTQFYPGYGYMYKSVRPEPVLLKIGKPLPQENVVTATPMNITAVSAVVGDIVTIGEGNHVFARGVCWGREPNPNIDGNHKSGDAVTGSQSVTLDKLTPNTTYYIRAYMVTDCGLSYGEEQSFTTLSSTVPAGAIDGLFSVSDSRQVYFSQGNLQFQASTGTWKFADNQYDYIGVGNSDISSSYSGWIDLFGWGTSGYHDVTDPYNVNYQPWSTSTSQVNSNYNYYGYGPSTNMTDLNLTGTSANYDWGVYNPISNGGNKPNQWRSLTVQEWKYVFRTRITNSGIRYAKAQVNEVDGVVLLPDDWSSNTFSLSNTNTFDVSFNSNVISATQWTTLENAGAVFLPVGGIRFGTSVSDVGSRGYYWTASYSFSSSAYGVYFSDSYLDTGQYIRYFGRGVRLVAVFEN